MLTSLFKAKKVLLSSEPTGGAHAWVALLDIEHPAALTNATNSIESELYQPSFVTIFGQLILNIAKDLLINKKC